MTRGRRLSAGETFERWTVIRSAGFRRQAGVNRARCVVRCVCGHERVAFEYMVKAGRTTGCRSRRCRTRWEAAVRVGGGVHRGIDAAFAAFLEAARRGLRE